MIIGGDGPDPSPDDVIQLDDQLAAAGIPALERPWEAAKLWEKKCGVPMLSLTKEKFFRQIYRKLHPSVPFDAASFLTLCISARGISYIIRPPMGYGRVAIKPVECTDITKDEVSRLWLFDKDAFYEFHWQALDAIDLFMSRMNFHPKSLAAENMIGTAINQLTASARQLVACEIDASIPQGMAMACELAGKAILLHAGADPSLLKKIGHNLADLHGEISSRILSPIDPIVDSVIRTLPSYVAVRYESPLMTILDAQDIYRRTMFCIADFLRRTNHDQAYWNEISTGTMPARAI